MQSNNYTAVVDPDKQLISMLKLAYRTADCAREDVYLITKPRTKLDTQENIPYCQLASLADEWEMTNGRLVQWRVQ